MKYIDHHAHMVSRTTDDYQQLALTGCVAVTEPAFWAGWDRSTADRIERFGAERTCVAGACDWGPSDPIAVPRFIMEMRRRRHPDELIHRIVFENPVQFLAQSPKFRI